MPVPARLFVVPLLFAASMAQAIRVEGIVREATTRMPMRGAVVRMERTGLPVEVCTTRIDGHYRFELKAGQRGVISFACKDRLTRRLVFDASAVPREWTDALAANVDVRLFPPMAGVDPALLNAPIGMASPKTPWGKVALGQRTRKNKATDKYIFRRRGKKRR